MPILNISSIHSFSSEDPAYPAANLLSRTSKKWRCKAASGQQTAFVCLQLDKPSRITGIDIGNESSAHISVLVGRLGARDEDFQEILLATTFMSATESRNGTGDPNRVRCFHNDALIASVAASTSTWQLIKVVCTQPYNRHLPFGLSFVKVHAMATAASADAKPAAPLVPAAHMQGLKAAAATAGQLAAPSSAISPFAKFRMRADSPSDSDGETSSAGLFSRWKQSKVVSQNSTSAAGAIRDATASPVASTSSARFVPRTPAPTKTTSNLAKTPTGSAGDGDPDSKRQPQDRNRASILYDSDDERPNERLDRKLQLDRSEREREQQQQKQQQQKPKTPQLAGKTAGAIAAEVGGARSRTSERSSDKFRAFLDDDSEVKEVKKAANGRGGSTSAVVKTTTPTLKRTLSPVATTSTFTSSRVSGAGAGAGFGHPSPAKRSKTAEAPAAASTSSEQQRTYKPFRQLLEGVVLVISGIQNPERGHLRDKALAMGAKYKPDWAAGCTHLICAFKNTPKYNQVHGHGHIIRKDWIADCHAQRKRIPWRRYALDSDDRDAPESDTEVLDIALKPADPIAPRTSPPAPVVDEATAQVQRRRSSPTPEKNHVLSSGSDTEDELERVRQRQQKKRQEESPPAAASVATKKKPQQLFDGDSDSDSVYNRNTDEDTRFVAAGGDATAQADRRSPRSWSPEDRRSCTPLPEFWAQKRFYLSSNLAAVDQLKLQRFVGVYGGEVIRNAAEADYIVSARAKQLPGDFAGEVVRPLWVYECNDMEQALPTARYKFD